MAGVLEGVRIVELAGIGPGPFCGMMLADHGAEVVRIERPGMLTSLGARSQEIVNRSRLSLALDLRKPEAVALVVDLCRTADGLIEGYRPGVTERLGLGPDRLLADNPRLVYGRMTGWGQEGPLADAPGHDINYLALAGNLHGYGRAGGKPTPPQNVVADIGGGGMLLAFGMVAGILGAQRTGKGQVIDCAMVDGAALVGSMAWMFLAQGAWKDERGTNMLDGGAHFYDSYECADGKFIALGAIEPQFYAALLGRLGLADDPAEFGPQMDAARWPEYKQRLESIFRTRTRAQWCELLDGADACFSPILSMTEAPAHPHNQARDTFVESAGVVQPAPAPRFSNSGSVFPVMPDTTDETEATLRRLSISQARIDELATAGAIRHGA